MSTCSVISSGVTLACPPPVAGVDASQIVLFNWDDIDQQTSTVTKTQASAIVRLNSPSNLGFIYEGINNSVRPNYTSVVEGFNPFKFNQTLEFRIFADDGATGDLEQDLSGTKVVAFYFTKSRLVKIMGWEVGLTATVSRNYYEEEGAALITLATPEAEFESKPPLTYIGASGSPIPDFETLKTEVLSWT